MRATVTFVGLTGALAAAGCDATSTGYPGLDAGHDDGGALDGGGLDGGPHLTRQCANYDGGDTDLGPIEDLGPIVPPDLNVPPPDLGHAPGTVNGCIPLRTCTAEIGADAGLTYDGFASPFFQAYCVRCHSTANVGTTREGAPNGYDWDDRTSVYAHLSEIRNDVGVSNSMPYDRPTDVSCERRRQMVTWIDTGAP